ncbi:Carrier protein, mitochondrial [Polyrhizophydium stewartii]|uniref:Carrier protein, mitochondrial n=1 Tax=Polyrhizophydium stewartii TaxID=2732419 RepID=A0ABR4NKP8_9FUNG
MLEMAKSSTITLASALLASLWFGTTAEAARSNNKAESTVSVGLFVNVVSLQAAQRLMGMRMAVSELNARSDILPDVTIAMGGAMVFARANLEPAKLYEQSINLCDTSPPIGGSTTYSSLANLANNLVCPTIPLFSMWAQTSKLSDKRLYPRFWRYTLPYASLIESLVPMIQYFGWSKVGLVTMNDGIFPETATYFNSILPAYGINVVSPVKIVKYNPAVSRLYYDQVAREYSFLKSTGLRIFIANVDATVLGDTMMSAKKAGIWGRNYDTPFDMSLLRGLIMIQSNIGPFLNDPYFQSWLPKFNAFRRSEIANNAALYPAINFQQTNPYAPDGPVSCFFDDPGMNQRPAVDVIGGYDGVMTLARAWDKAGRAAINDAGTTGRALANGSLAGAITLAAIVGDANNQPSLTGLRFTSIGDPSADRTRVAQIDISGGSMLVVTTGVIGFDPATDEPATFAPNASKFIWPGNRTFEDVPIDFPPQAIDYASISETGVRVVLACAAIVAVVFLAFAAVALLGRHNKLKFHAPKMQAAASIGIAIMQLHPLTLVGQDKPLGCSLRPWPVPFGLMILLSSIASKHYFIYIIFSFSTRKIHRKILELGSVGQIVLLAVPVFIAFTLLIAYSFADPMRSALVYYDTTSSYAWACVGSNSSTTSAPLYLLAALVAVMLGSVLLLAHLTKSIQNEFGESLQLFSTVLVILILGGFSFLQSSQTTSVRQQFYVESIMALAGGVILFVLILGRIAKDLTELILAKLVRGSVGKILQKVPSLRNSASCKTSTSSDGFDVHRCGVTGDIRNEQRNVRREPIVHVRLLKNSLLPQWRLANVMILPPPVASLRYIEDHNPDLVNFLPLKYVTAVRTFKGLGDPRESMCEVDFGKNHLVLSFSTPAKTFPASPTTRGRMASVRTPYLPEAQQDFIAIAAAGGMRKADSTPRQPSTLQLMLSAGSGSVLTSLLSELQLLTLIRHLFRLDGDVMGGRRQPSLAPHLAPVAASASTSGSAAASSAASAAEGVAGTGTLRQMAAIVRSEGIRALWRGLTPTLILSVPSTAVYYAGYDLLRANLGAALSRVNAEDYAPLFSGAIARTFSATVISPIELVRTRMQAGDKSMAEIVRGVGSTVRVHGIGSLWRGLAPTLWRDAPFSAMYWFGYEFFKARVVQRDANGRATNEMLASFISGSLSGTLAAIATHPFDVAKTIQQVAQTSGPHGAEAPSMSFVFRGVLEQSGWRGLFVGLAPRIAKVAPACGVMISSYEAGKRLFADL